MVLLWCSRSVVSLGVGIELKEVSMKDKCMRKKYMRAESVGLREMVVIINRLASMVNWKMNKKTMKSILYKCGFFGALASCSEVALYFSFYSMDTTVGALTVTHAHGSSGGAWDT